MTERWRERMEREVRAAVRALGAVAAAEPVPGTLAVAARRLRGAAWLARQDPVSTLAAALERLGTAGDADPAAWDALTPSVVHEAIALLRRLDAQRPSVSEDAALEGLTARLQRRLPAATPSETRGEGAGFLAARLSAVVSALRHVALDPGSDEAATVATRELAAVRGIAAVSAMPPLSEILDAIDRALAEAPPRRRGAPLPPTVAAILHAGADALAESLGPLAQGALPPTDSAAIDAFADALRAYGPAPSATRSIVPIQALLTEDATGDLPPHDPLRARARFQLEASPWAEALRECVSESRRAQDAVTRVRVSTDLHELASRLAALADSFAEPRVAGVLRAVLDGAARLDPKAIWILDDLAAVLADPAGRLTELDQAVSVLDARLSGSQPAPTAPPTARERRATPAGLAAALPSIEAFLLPPTTPG